MTTTKTKPIMVLILVAVLFCGMVRFSPWVSAASSETANDTETLQAAFNSVDNNGTIQITSDITLSADIITSTNNNFLLDLNGYKIIATDYRIVNRNRGTITIRDSSTNGNGIILSENNINGMLINMNNGSIIIESGTFSSNLGYVIGNLSEGSVTINGGTILSNNGVAISNATGIATINGGTIKATSDTADVCAIHNLSTGSVIINGGTIEAMVKGHGCSIINSSAGTITVSGGTIDASGEYGIGILMYDEQGGKLNINYGSSTIKGTGQAIVTDNTSSLSIANSIDCVAYNEYDMTKPLSFNLSDLGNYKALVFSPKVPWSSSGLSFKEKAANEDGVITLGLNITDFNATSNYDGLDVSGLQPDIGSVGTVGTDGSVVDGPFVITLNKDYLNTLKAGQHALIVNIKGGGYDGAKVIVPVTVEAITNTPNTGDNQMIMVWASMLILTACVGAVVIKKKKSSIN